MSKGNSNQDWRSQLAQLSKQMKADMSEDEKRQIKKEEDEKRKRRYEINKRKKSLYEFLAGYKQNSGIFINNFFRNRDYQTYCDDKFHAFDFSFGIILPNVFDDFEFSMQMVRYLKELEEVHCAYFPVDRNYIKHLINLAEVLELSDPLEYDTIFYRGCSTIERNGVNGVASITSDPKIAEQFSRGTILTVHVPKGVKCLNINAIRPREQRKKDLEQEFLLPPCEFEIISDRKVKSGREPNNYTGETRLLEVTVRPLNLLEEFLKMMENPPKEYLPLQQAQGDEYKMALSLLKSYIQRKNQNNENIKTYYKTFNKK